MPKRKNRLDRARGVTVIELMVTVAVLAILLGVAIPNVQRMIASHRVITATHELYAAIQRARLEAIRRGVRVTLCKGAANASQCDTDTSSDWKNGWILFTDPVTQTPAQIDSSSQIIARGGGYQAADLRILGRTTNALSLYVSFTPDGAGRLMNGGFLAGRIRICSTSSALANSDRAREIVINAPGRPVIEQPASVAATCPAP